MRVFAPEMTTVSFSRSYLSLFNNTEISSAPEAHIAAPEIAFNEIKFPVEKKIVKRAVIVASPRKNVAAKMTFRKVEKNELSFYGPIKLNPLYMHNDLPVNLVSLYTEIKTEYVAQSENIADEVSTQMAASEEPEFFTYETPVKEETKAVASASEIHETNKIEEVAALDIPQKTVSPEVEEVELDNLLTFDYSQAQADIKKVAPQTVTSQVGGLSAAQVSPVVSWSETKKSKSKNKTIPVISQNALNEESHNFLKSNLPDLPRTFENRVTIQISGSDLKSNKPEVGFEIKFQDDLGESVQDYNSGVVTIDQTLSEEKMTRSLVVLKRGFIPTNTDLILEEGAHELVLPIIEEDTFNEMMAPFESRGPIGAVLVELDDKTEDVSLDVPYSQVLKLNEKMEVTEGDSFLYQLFVGVKAGNALVTYKSQNETLASKIIHVHEREVTFEINIFEELKKNKLQLVEEDLLAKEKTPLVISSSEVKEFATENLSSKLNNHTYKLDFNESLLGSRKYVELMHQSEPVYVGFKNNLKLEVPSENFMRYILSRFENSKLGNRCLVQINMKKKAVHVEVGSESVAESLMTSTQILDADGKFYNSVSAKSQKIIIVGENQGAPGLSQDGKINIKINYQDGSTQYLGSYCSPNTYLVEQL